MSRHHTLFWLRYTALTIVATTHQANIILGIRNIETTILQRSAFVKRRTSLVFDPSRKLTQVQYSTSKRVFWYTRTQPNREVVFEDALGLNPRPITSTNSINSVGIHQIMRPFTHLESQRVQENPDGLINGRLQGAVPRYHTYEADNRV